MLLDGQTTVVEMSAIIEHLAAFHPGQTPLIPADAKAAAPVRLWDRVFASHVMTPMQSLVSDARRAPADRDPWGFAQAHAALDTVYDWLDDALAGRPWAVGETFTLADAAAAPALLYADLAHPIGEDRLTLKTYRARFQGRPSVRRCVDDARPFRPFVPLGAPERD